MFSSSPKSFHTCLRECMRRAIILCSGSIWHFYTRGPRLNKFACPHSESDGKRGWGPVGVTLEVGWEGRRVLFFKSPYRNVPLSYCVVGVTTSLRHAFVSFLSSLSDLTRSLSPSQAHTLPLPLAPLCDLTGAGSKLYCIMTFVNQCDRPHHSQLKSYLNIFYSLSRSCLFQAH
ncbi:hypothetical protein RRG08_016991 [Elysia crispata]|uniref:Uncharacterized protein n=1 Tax=Elysia crispata TaxID=231223 RepID=A0AAE0XYX1_9GAST|nr:hypothetical protein RRG08_016991 [Elysia crispata]